jgi:LEA14-like dessication related protein
MRRAAPSSLMLAGAALLAACALAPKFSPPQLTVVGVQLQGSSLWEQRLRVRMHVQNPNDRILPVKGIEYTLEVQGQQFASGVSAASFVVPAMGEAEFDMDVTTDVAGALLRLMARAPEARSQSIAYHLTGKVSLSAGLLRSIPFDEHGSFSLQ